ncbi:LacI family DNA-binding transcriptional regulator [Microbacterium sp. LTA6]|uniref:LacI family DNA-binding transcriptional regulator n=1 Tax=unclassified Microbacterium TaxID=2609290 RepID=UPI003139C5FC
MMEKPVTRRVTLADVARQSGMSKAAVSMILNDKPGTRLSEQATERVRAAAAELGYRPNPAAQSLRLGKTRAIGFISDQVTITRYASGMISGVLAAAKEYGHTVLIAEAGEAGQSGIADAFESMIDRRVDGVLVGLLGARLIDLPETTVPVVVVNGTTTADHPSILPDEHTAGLTVVRRLTSAGHRRIGLIGDVPHAFGNPRESVTIDLRFAGMEEAFAEAGVIPVRVAVPDWIPQVGYAETHRMLDAHPDLTAILACNDNVAFGVYQALAERGTRVPHDISVISYDDEELAGYQRPGLTTARLPYEEMARRGVRMLLGDSEPAHELVPMPLIERESVGAPA